MSRSALHASAAAGLALLLAAAPAAAVTPEGPPPPLAQAWSLSMWTLLPLVAVVAVYAVGIWRTRPPFLHVIAGVGGLVALALAVLWPFDAWAAYALSAHVAQHMLLLALAPPLLVIARPARLLAGCVPARLRTTVERCAATSMRRLHAPLGLATLVHVVVLWTWHLPAATSAALVSEPVHRLMLASVLLAGLWFWSAVLARLHTRDGAIAGALVALVTAMMLMGFLGALLTFSPRLLYPAYTDRALLAGLDALADQQLAGLLMWVPGGLPYLAVGLWLAVVWMRGVQRAAA